MVHVPTSPSFQTLRFSSYQNNESANNFENLVSIRFALNGISHSVVMLCALYNVGRYFRSS